MGKKVSEIFVNFARLVDEVTEDNRARSFVHDAKDPLAYFDCVSEPGISAGTFLRLVQPLIEPEEWVITAILSNRLLQKTGAILGTFNAHCLTTTALMIGIKLFRDVKAVPKVFNEKTGVPVKDLVKMERMFLSLIDWEIHINGAEYDAVQSLLNSPRAGEDSTASSVMGRLCGAPCSEPSSPSFSTKSGSSHSSARGGNIGRLRQMVDQCRGAIVNQPSAPAGSRSPSMPKRLAVARPASH